MGVLTKELLLAILVAGPIVLATLIFLCPVRPLRSFLVAVSALLTLVAGLVLAFQGSFTLSLEAPAWGMGATALELLVTLFILVIGVRVRSWVVSLLAIGQVGMVVASLVMESHGSHRPSEVIVDPLAIMLLLIVSVIGSLIVLYAIGYMRKHEEHAPATAASSNRFFFFLVAFLGFMNGLVVTDDLRWLSFFWECTTLCSFFLIGHDGTPEARKNARWALVVNTFGGAAMTLASLVALHETGAESLSQLMAKSALFPIALLSLAAMTKSAQMPFQSWLLGAMVAPTPVSALLHSSTMVKAGSYLILRVAPSIGETPLAGVLAFAGAFTFALASALAISQSNGKKVLAYSTIANLGLIVACAGLNTPLAYAAALVILCFHAVSKALLFLSIGTVEQTIGSREIEDMSGILHRMPLTTTVAILGMVSMVVPPFGMLIGKWMAIEAAVCRPLVLVFVIIGSALTLFFWAKWIGRITTVSYHPKYSVEKVPALMLTVLTLLFGGVLVLAVAALPMYHYWFKPISAATYHLIVLGPASDFVLMDSIDSYRQWPLYGVLVFVMLAIWGSVRRFRKEHVRLPYLCGENYPDEDVSYEFRSLMDARNTAYVTSYYLAPLFGEGAITLWANPVATMIILAMFGVILHGNLV